MSDSDNVCKIINCEHYSDCVCEKCDCIEKAYNKGKRDSTRWIPCSERLPEEKGDYIVTMKSETITNMYYDTTYFYNHISYHAYRPIEDILAWMPLPEPYKEQMKEEEIKKC